MATICPTCNRRVSLGEPMFAPGQPCWQCRQRMAMQQGQMPEMQQATGKESWLN